MNTTEQLDERPVRRLALTLWPEWAWAITHLGKDIENRDWKQDDMIGRWLCIHAGKHIGGRPGKTACLEGLDSLSFTAWALNKELPAQSDLISQIPTSSIVAVCKVAGFSHGPADGWYMGEPGYGWQLREVRILPEPVPCKGARGLWPLPSEVLFAVREQLRSVELPGTKAA